MFEGRDGAGKGGTLVTVDDGVRPGTTVETLAKVRPAFKIGGPVTAGNSSQMTDGAAVALVVSEEYLEKLGKSPMARFLAFSATGCAPEVMGIGPITAIPSALKLAGLKIEDIDLIELAPREANQRCVTKLQSGRLIHAVLRRGVEREWQAIFLDPFLSGIGECVFRNHGGMTSRR